jgi:hypothetical protein
VFRAAQHFVGYVQTYYIARAGLAGHAARSPSCPAAKIQDAIARLDFHQLQRLVGNVGVVVFHLVAASGRGPLVELFLKFLVGLRWDCVSSGVHAAMLHLKLCTAQPRRSPLKPRAEMSP